MRKPNNVVHLKTPRHEVRIAPLFRILYKIRAYVISDPIPIHNPYYRN